MYGQKFVKWHLKFRKSFMKCARKSRCQFIIMHLDNLPFFLNIAVFPEKMNIETLNIMYHAESTAL